MKGREWKYKLNLAQLLRFRATFYILFILFTEVKITRQEKSTFRKNGAWKSRN